MPRTKQQTTALWLSYDLGLLGDYAGLYGWLDAHGAKACGASMAFVPGYTYRGDLHHALRSELGRAVRRGQRDRIYVIAPTPAGALQGRFLFGQRTQAPWAGCAPSRGSDAPDEARPPVAQSPPAPAHRGAQTRASHPRDGAPGPAPPSSSALPIDIETVDPRERALIDFFSRARAVEAALDRWRLAIWCPRRPDALTRTLCPAWPGDEAQPGLAVFGWRRKRRARWAALPVAEVLRHLDLLEAGQRVVLARRELPPEAFQLLRAQLGYEPDIAGQVLGWWYDLDDALPEEPPPWRPTGSLLPASGGDLRHGGMCLVLIEVDDCWYVLSERALLTYAFGSRLAEGEPLRFVRSTRAGLERWLATPAAGISYAEVEKRFGPAVARRVRRDAVAVMVCVHREIRA